MLKLNNKAISTPIAIAISVVCAIVVFGGVFAYKYWWQGREEGEAPESNLSGPEIEIPEMELVELIDEAKGQAGQTEGQTIKDDFFVEEMEVREIRFHQHSLKQAEIMHYGQIDLSQPSSFLIGAIFLNVQPVQIRCSLSKYGVADYQKYLARCPLFANLSTTDNFWVEFISIDCSFEEDCQRGSRFELKNPSNELIDTQKISFSRFDHTKLRIEEFVFDDKVYILISGGSQGNMSGDKDYFLYVIEEGGKVKKIDQWDCVWNYEDFESCDVSPFQIGNDKYLIRGGVLNRLNNDDTIESIGDADGLFIKDGKLYFEDSEGFCYYYSEYLPGMHRPVCRAGACVPEYHTLTIGQGLQKVSYSLFKQEYQEVADGHEEKMMQADDYLDNWLSPLIGRTLNLIFAGEEAQAWDAFSEDYTKFLANRDLSAICDRWDLEVQQEEIRERLKGHEENK